MSKGHFNLVEHFLGATEENVHVWTAGLVAGLLVLAAAFLFLRLRKVSESVMPDRGVTLRAMMEMMIDMIRGLCDDIIGPHGRKYVPFVGTLFLFILANNLIGMVPGFLPPTENWATNAALATIVFIAFNYFGFREHGLAYFGHFTAPLSLKGVKSATLFTLLLIPLILFQCLFGAVELVSLLLRPFTLTIRLLVNIMADHLVASIFSGMVPILVPIPFLALGLLVSVLQALVFTLLTIVYISLATARDH